MRLRLLQKLGIYSLLAVLLILTLVPVILMLLFSFRDGLDIMINFWSLPETILWDNYTKGFQAVYQNVLNSLYVCVITVLLGLTMGSLSGYAFARHRFPFKNSLFMLLLGVMMIPSVLTIVPLYSLINTYQLTGSYWGLILPYTAGTQLLAVFLCRNFFEGVPGELFEAARVDGASELYTFLRIALPLCVPILITVGIINFLAVYNDYIWPLVVLNESQYTFSVAVVNLATSNTSDTGVSTAAYVVGSVPTLLVLIFGMRYYIQGMVNGAVKS